MGFIINPYRFAVAGGWDLSNASYTGNNYSFSSQGTDAHGVFISSDGTKMYMYDYNTRDVFQYTLSTAYDCSTASYASKSLDTSSQSDDAGGIFISPDGTKIYTIGFYWNGSANVANIHQYTMSTPWDMSTASYDSKSYTVTQEDLAFGVYMKTDGTKFYVVGQSNDTIYQYSMSTPWDISTGSYDSKSFSVSSQESSPQGVALSDDGLKCFVCGAGGGNIYEYDLSTEWDISTASYDGVTLSTFSVQGDVVRDIVFGKEGQFMYVVGHTDYFYQWSTTWLEKLSIIVTIIGTSHE